MRIRKSNAVLQRSDLGTCPPPWVPTTTVRALPESVARPSPVGSTMGRRGSARVHGCEMHGNVGGRRAPFDETILRSNTVYPSFKPDCSKAIRIRRPWLLATGRRRLAQDGAAPCASRPIEVTVRRLEPNGEPQCRTRLFCMSTLAARLRVLLLSREEFSRNGENGLATDAKNGTSERYHLGWVERNVTLGVWVLCSHIQGRRVSPLGVALQTFVGQ